jgi:hypothetical protein
MITPLGGRDFLLLEKKAEPGGEKKKSGNRILSSPFLVIKIRLKQFMVVDIDIKCWCSKG